MNILFYIVLFLFLAASIILNLTALWQNRLMKDMNELFKSINDLNKILLERLKKYEN